MVLLQQASDGTGLDLQAGPGPCASGVLHLAACAEA